VGAEQNHAWPARANHEPLPDPGSLDRFVLEIRTVPLRVQSFFVRVQLGQYPATVRRHAPAAAFVVLACATPLPAQTPPAPYSLPWLLRPAVVARTVRLDQTLALHEDALTGGAATTAVTSVTTTLRLGARFAAVGRATWTRYAPPPGRRPSGSGLSNPLLGVSYVRPFASRWRWTGFLASTVPVGAGGGDRPDPGAVAAQAAAIPARSAMDNAMFAVNYHVLIGGLSLARVSPRLTAQAELTALQLTRVRGPDSQDASRTNLTVGLHLGHFLTPRVSVGADLRLQRWMTNAAPVRADRRAREQLTVALGSRLHLRSGGRWIRPGLSYTRALDGPMSRLGYDILQFDVPVSF